jgi:F-type H+-transporting ATPase subunit epsilon
MAKDCFTLKIVTPERTFYEGSATMLEMNTTEGEMGVYPRHIPMTVIIAPGVLNIYEETGEVKKAALHAGFAEILPDQITILAEIIEWPSEIDEKRAEEARRRAEERLRTKAAGIDIIRAEAALHRALTRIDVLH